MKLIFKTIVLLFITSIAIAKPFTEKMSEAELRTNYDEVFKRANDNQKVVLAKNTIHCNSEKSLKKAIGFVVDNGGSASVNDMAYYGCGLVSAVTVGLIAKIAKDGMSAMVAYEMPYSDQIVLHHVHANQMTTFKERKAMGI